MKESVIKRKQFFLEQLNNGFSKDFYLKKLEKVEKLLSVNKLDKDTQETRKLCYERMGFIDEISDAYNRLVGLVDSKLFPKDFLDSKKRTIKKTILKDRKSFFSLLYYGNGNTDLVSIYRDIDKNIDGLINTTRESLVELIDKYAKIISFEKQVKLSEYKELFNSAYDYVNQALKNRNIEYCSKLDLFEEVLIVRKEDNAFDLLDLYSYSYCDEIINILILENSGLKINRLDKLKERYMDLARKRIRLRYLSIARDFMTNNTSYSKFKTILTKKINRESEYINVLDGEAATLYNKLKINEKVKKCTPKEIFRVNRGQCISICKVIEEKIEEIDYLNEKGYYYSYYKGINKMKRYFDRKIGDIKVPNYVINSVGKNSSVDLLAEQFLDLYVEIGNDAYDEKIFTEYIEEQKKKIEINEYDESFSNKDEGISILGYNSLINYEPLLPSDGSNKIIFERREKLDSILAMKRAQLKNEYNKLIVNKGYNLTFYEFLKTKKDIISPKIITYERENELFAAILYKAYLESGVKSSFVELANKKGLDDVPTQYINPELYEDEEEEEKDQFNIRISNSDDFDILDTMINDTLNAVMGDS